MKINSEIITTYDIEQEKNYLLALNPNLPQALNNIAVIYHSQALSAQASDDDLYYELSKQLFNKAEEYWKQALKLAPDNYPGARNWLKVTGRLNDLD